MYDTVCSQVLFSTLTGSNYYFPVPGRQEKNRLRYRHAAGQGTYLLKPLPADNADPLMWGAIARHPADVRFVWPVDVVWYRRGDEPGFALLLPEKADFTGSAYRSLAAMLRVGSEDVRTIRFSWKKAKTRHILLELLGAFEAFEAKGYLYHGFSAAHVFYNPATATLRIGANGYMTDAGGDRKIDHSFSLREETDPWLLHGGQSDRMSCRFSLAALAFRLMLGRYPYDGGLLSGVQNATPVEHEHWLKAYHRQPSFLFDPDSRENAIGLFSHERPYVALWESLTPELRDLFCGVFRRENALRTAGAEFPSAARLRDAVVRLLESISPEDEPGQEEAAP